MSGLLMNYEELFKEHFTSRDKNYTLANTLRFWQKMAGARNISGAVLEVAISRVFNRLAGGEKFDGPCACGCGGAGIATPFIHAVLLDMVTLDEDTQGKIAELLNMKFSKVVEDQMRRIAEADKEFIKMHRPPLWDRNPILKRVKKAWTYLRS
jgi:hypothetical protein